MISDNLRNLRRQYNLTQEMLAEKINVSRQSIVKWESGESLPDILNCVAMAKFYGVPVDRIVNSQIESEEDQEKKHIFGIVEMDESGKITIPEKAREIFDLTPHCGILVLGDEEKGIALVKCNL